MPATLTSASDFLENKLLDLVFNGVTYTPPSNVFVQRYSAAPSDAGGGTPVGTRQAVSFATASGMSASSAADVTFSAATGNTVAVGLFDAATGGNLLFWGEVDAAVDPAGDSLLIKAGQLTVKFALTGTTGISTALGNALLNHVLRSESYSPSAVEVALWTASGEVNGGGYARQVTTFGDASGGSVANTSTEEWTMPGADVNALRAYAPAASGGMHLWSWSIPAKTYAAGSVATLAAGALTATIN